MNSPTAPIEKNIVLVGAGNAHLIFLKRWGMRPQPGVAVTLVNEANVIPYSAMVPGHIAGDYSWDDVTIDLVRLCQSVGVRLVVAKVTSLDRQTRQVHFETRPPLAYDVLALGVGSRPTCPADCSEFHTSLALRPLAGLLRKLDALAEALRERPRSFHFVVVGGGASGCELALALRKRLGRGADVRLTLLQGGPRLLPEFPIAVANAFERRFAEEGVAFRINARVSAMRPDAVQLDDGTSLAADTVLWATQAAAPLLLGKSGLSVDSGGFLRINETLQSANDPSVFGTGDCVAFGAFPELAKNGVHAVREGGVLFDNVLAFLHEQRLRPFLPQRFCLALLNTADGEAVLRYGPLSWKGRWPRRLKDRIDRAWMMKFTPSEIMENADAGESGSLMRCGGCGSKISSDVLSAVLKRLDLPDDPRVLMGTRAGEDAAVYRTAPELFGTQPQRLVEVQTVDYFKAFVDDPYLFGRIAALNAVSDLYAMNARPFSALAIATLPYARGRVQEAMLFELLTGAAESLRELGVVLTGGHTTEGSELALGFAVTGHGEEDRLFRKSALQVGDALILTKPLGSGALLAAWMRGACRAAWFEKLVGSMLQSNKAAGEIFARAEVTACTDVTGFGLAGHLLEMLDGSRVSARLSADAIPLYDGFADVVNHGIVSTLHADNAKASCRIQGSAPLSAWLFDPQTSGGLLAGVASDQAGGVLLELHRAGMHDAAIVGNVIMGSLPALRLD